MPAFFAQAALPAATLLELFAAAAGAGIIASNFLGWRGVDLAIEIKPEPRLLHEAAALMQRAALTIGPMSVGDELHIPLSI